MSDTQITNLQWKNVTVKQFMQIGIACEDNDIDSIDKRAMMIAATHNKSMEEVAALSMDEWVKAWRKTEAFTDNIQVPTIPLKKLKINGRRYRVDYRLAHVPLTFRNKLELGEYSMSNLNAYLTAFIYPVNWYGKRKKIDQKIHEQDMLDVPIVNVVGTLWFFMLWWEKSRTIIKVTNDKSGVPFKKTKERLLEFEMDLMKHFPDIAKKINEINVN